MVRVFRHRLLRILPRAHRRPPPRTSGDRRDTSRPLSHDARAPAPARGTRERRARRRDRRRRAARRAGREGARGCRAGRHEPGAAARRACALRAARRSAHAALERAHGRVLGARGRRV
jgi:hypothetical protein